MRFTVLVLVATVASSAVCARGGAAELVFPGERQAHYSSEPIKLAVAGLAKDAAATLEFVPQDSSALPVSVAVKGDGSTVTLLLPAGALAPGTYRVDLDGRPAAKLTISTGVGNSTCLLSQTIGWDQLRASGAGFIVGNAFSFGRLTGGRPRTTDLRGSRSAGLTVFDRAVALDLPTLVYMYWTGYVTHKPFGSQKSWASADVQQATRLLSFHTAQRLRRFAKNVISVGTLDEPGLSWGKTSGGGMASGFPNWDEQAWYEARGWQLTHDPAARSDEDWLKYMAVRCAILKEHNAQAARDLKTVWPEMAFSTDLYAPHAIMDGTDPLNQQANDFPSSHVFVDWGIDRLGAYSGVMLEKAHDPTARLAHAMNGQLFGQPVPQPGQRYAYRVCLSGMLAAGLASNWWLNTGGMSSEDLAAVNGPAQRLGPLLREMTSAGHDVAVLWSFTEIALREKDMAAQEAAKKTGEQIRLMVASLPENTALKKVKQIEINAYSIGQDYKEAVLTAHYALSRAGYPAHIIHERLLPGGILNNYRTLVIVGQTFALPPEVMRAIAAFVSSGGKIVVDQSTTVDFDHPIVAQTNLKGLSYRWNALFNQDPASFKTPGEASYYQTNHFMDEPVRRAVAPLKAAMGQTASVARVETDSNELVVERHVGGEGQLYMLINGYEELPKIGQADSYFIYNYAPHQARYTLRGLPENCVVYTIEGGDWSKAGKLADPHGPIAGSFEPGEMKLYLVAPREPDGLDVAATAAGSGVSVAVRLKNVKMPWPLIVTVHDPAGKVLYRVFRATGVDGAYREEFPLGSNAAAGVYAVKAASPLANLAGQSQVRHQPSPAVPQVVPGPVYVADGPVICSFLAGKPELVIAVGSDSHQGLAEKLAAGLSAQGIRATVRPEAQVLRKVRYPRVWNPYATVYRAAGPEKPLDGRQVDRQIELAVDAEGTITAKGSDGKDLGHDWRQPNSLVTIAGEGYVDYSGDAEICYEPGVKLHIGQSGRLTVVKGQPTEQKTTEQFKAKWSRPWTQLTSHVGAYQLPPQLPEAYTADGHLILLGDSTTSRAVAALQASDLLPELADAAYPGPGKALVSFAWSPFAVEKNAILVGAADEAGLAAGVARLLELVR